MRVFHLVFRCSLPCSMTGPEGTARRAFFFLTVATLLLGLPLAAVEAGTPFSKRPLVRKRKSVEKSLSQEKPQTKFHQVAPPTSQPTKLVRSKDQLQAVVLIHGYWLHIKKDRVASALFKDWQTKNSSLVTSLAKSADVFAFAYGQTLPVEQIARLPVLSDNIDCLKKLGYSQITLIGHSAGGLVARLFVEDNPKAGVTKIVQISCPNSGCGYADFKFVPANQKTFVNSLSKTARESSLKARPDKKIPPEIQFICIVGAEDFVVPAWCQWPVDLQDQGVPAFRVETGHRLIVRKPEIIKQIVTILGKKHARWTKAEVAVGKKAIFRVAQRRKGPSRLRP